ncbi:7942_t:CDS:2, partial [Gigaspora margarita]
GLHVKTLTFIVLSELATLEEAIVSAHRVEAKEELGSPLQKIEKIALNYAAFNEKCPKKYQGKKKAPKKENKEKGYENLELQPGINKEVAPYKMKEVTPTKKPEERGDLNQTKKKGNEYVNAELTEDRTSRKEEVGLWYNNTEEEKVILTTEKESKVFVIFISDNDDDKTVQGEEDLPNPLLNTINDQIPRTLSIWYQMIPDYRF